MSALPLFESAAKGRIAAMVGEIEAGTSAEIVVVVRIRSGYYRHTDYLVGSLCALAAVMVFLFHPRPFDDRLHPFALVLSFALGALFSSRAEPLRRALTRRGLLEGNVRTTARAVFVEHGVSRTTGRTGLLVYASIFERHVELVADVGIDEETLGAGYLQAKRALSVVLRSSIETSAFEHALRRLAAPLAEGLPRAADDVNELLDEVRS